MNYLAMAARDEAHGAQDFQHGHLHFGIVGRQTLRDDFDRRRVRQHVRPSRLQKLSEKKNMKRKADCCFRILSAILFQKDSNNNRRIFLIRFDSIMFF